MTTAQIFDSMDYGPAPESDTEALDWIAKHDGAFGHFIGGGFTKPGATFASKNPATGAELAQISQGTEADVNAAVKAARKAFPAWSKQTGHARARHLYALARLLQKHSRLFAVLETLDNGKPIREARDIDVPLAQRHLYYHAGLAQLVDDELPDHQPLGVCGQVIPWNFPLLMLAWKIAPALAAGNTAVLKPAEFTSLTALLFAEICAEAGLPPGVVNIVTGDGATGALITEHPDIAKVAFTGSTEVGRRIRQATAGSGKALTLELGGKSPYIVFDDADLDSAVEGLVDAIWFNQGQVCCAGSRLLVQEPVSDAFHAKLTARMDKLRMGNPLDKSIDIGAVVDPAQHAAITAMVEGNTDGHTHRAAIDMPDTGCFYPPTLITGLDAANPLMQEEIFGPVLVGTTFRTPAEAAALANNTRYGLAATVWTENVNLALDMAPKLAAGVVWINATNLFDASAPFGGVRESGFGREGGWEGLSAYLKPPLPLAKAKAPAEAKGQGGAEGIDRTAKLYIGGKQARPDSGYSRPVYGTKGKLLGHVGMGSRKDVRNAVEAARAAASWANTTGHLRAQILYYLAENLSARGAEFADRLQASTGAPKAKAKAEVDDAISRLFSFAALADKVEGRAKPVPMRGMAMALREPVGLIGALAPEEAPLLAPVTLMGAAMAMGNRLVLVAGETAPLIATDLYQVLDTSDVPAGVVNILTGTQSDMASTLADHLELDAIWSFSGSVTAATIETAAAGNLKRSWTNSGTNSGTNTQTGQNPDWSRVKAHAFIDPATEVKTIWVPYGA